MTDNATQSSRTGTTFGADLDELISQEFEGVVELRRALHRYPEAGLDLPHTQSVVAKRLRELGLEVRLGREIGSVMSVVRGSEKGPTFLLRADMDALPIAERTGLDFASKVPGVMHACGHDLHTASLLGVAAVLKHLTSRFRGNVILMFQPGEEGYFGARKMIDDHLLDPELFGVSAPTRAFALHVNPWYPTGSVNVRNGPILAAADSFQIKLIGSAGHGSAPHAALDPIPAMCELVQAIQSHVSRRISAFEPTVVSVTSISAGTEATRSAIPGTAMISGTMRTLSEKNRAALFNALTALSEGVGAAHGLGVEVTIDAGYPVTVNDKAATESAITSMRARLPEGAVQIMDNALMGSEDFSYVLQHVPGSLAFIGTTPAADLSDVYPPDNHSDSVLYDEEALRTFMAAHLAVVEGYLGHV